MFALAAVGEDYAECGDVSPSTKLSNCTPWGGSDPGRAGDGVCLYFWWVFLFSCGVFPSGAGEVSGSSQFPESLLGLGAMGVSWESSSRMGRGCPGQ